MRRDVLIFLVVLGCHEAQQNVRHAKVAEPPCQHGERSQCAVSGSRTGLRIIYTGQAQIARQRTRVGEHGVYAASHMCCVDNNDYNGNRHNNGLNQIRGAGRQKAAQCTVTDNDCRADNHGEHVVHTEQLIKQLAAGSKAGSSVRNEENDDDDSGNRKKECAFCHRSDPRKSPES